MHYDVATLAVASSKFDSGDYVVANVNRRPLVLEPHFINYMCLTARCVPFFYLFSSYYSMLALRQHLQLPARPAYVPTCMYVGGYLGT